LRFGVVHNEIVVIDYLINTRRFKILRHLLAEDIWDRGISPEFGRFEKTYKGFDGRQSCRRHLWSAADLLMCWRGSAWFLGCFSGISSFLIQELVTFAVRGTHLNEVFVVFVNVIEFYFKPGRLQGCQIITSFIWQREY